MREVKCSLSDCKPKGIQRDVKETGLGKKAVERFFRWLKSFRRIIIRCERLASTCKALLTIASIIIHLRYGI